MKSLHFIIPSVSSRVSIFFRVFSFFSEKFPSFLGEILLSHVFMLDSHILAKCLLSLSVGIVKLLAIIRLRYLTDKVKIIVDKCQISFLFLLSVSSSCLFFFIIRALQRRSRRCYISSTVNSTTSSRQSLLMAIG